MLMTRMWLVGVAVIVSTLTALLAFFAFPHTAQANHSWNGYHWARTNNPFTLPLGDNVTAAWDSYLAAASGPAQPSPADPSPTFTSTNDWSDSSVMDTKIVAGGTTRKRCRPTSGRVEVCNYTYGTNGWLGLAQIWLSGSHIVQSTTKVNDSYFNTATYNKPAWRHLVMCQEVGHTFGLDHQDETKTNANLGTCMDYTNDPDGGAGGTSATDPSNEQPNQHDYDQLVSIYTHTDLRTTIASTSAASTLPPAANRGGFNSRAEWGRKLRESRDGQLKLFVRHFGSGARLFTWVIAAS